MKESVGGCRKSLRLNLAPLAALEVGQNPGALVTGQYAESQLRQRRLGVATDALVVPVVGAHHCPLSELVGSVIAVRNLDIPARIRVFAVPRGIDSNSLISAAVFPQTAAST